MSVRTFSSNKSTEPTYLSVFRKSCSAWVWKALGVLPSQPHTLWWLRGHLRRRLPGREHRNRKHFAEKGKVRADPEADMI